MGRKKIEIDWAEVDKYLQYQCDGVGISGLLGICPHTLYRACERDNKVSFAKYSAQKKSEGKELLRAKQMELALKGDKTLLVWLGKQYLDQSDKSQSTIKEVDEFEGKTIEEINAEIEAIEQRGSSQAD